MSAAQLWRGRESESLKYNLLFVHQTGVSIIVRHMRRTSGERMKTELGGELRQCLTPESRLVDEGNKITLHWFTLKRAMFAE